MKSFWLALSEWSEETFGPSPQRGPRGPLKHLQKEVKEALQALDWLQSEEASLACGDPQADPQKAELKLKFELVDCLFLVFDAARRAGLSYEELREKAFEKLEINKARQWAKPTADGAVEHIREAASEK